MSEAIAIIAPAADVHARRVRDLLLAGRYDAHLIDFSAMALRPSLSMRFGGDSDPHNGVQLLTTSGAALDASTVGAVWYRRPRPPELPQSVLWQADRDFGAAQWTETLRSISSLLSARFVSPPVNQLLATKPRQLQVATGLGLRVPDTLITNDDAAVRRFVESHNGRIIHKSLAPAPHQFVETRAWRQSDSDQLPLLSLAPSIFQERIEGDIDLRVTYVGGEMFTAHFPIGDQVDSRIDLDVPYTACQLDPLLEAKLRLLMERLGLLFGTIDLRISRAGDPVFFEINPQGQFLYVEILTGMRISERLASFLVLQSQLERHAA